jgi:16S rRNA (cytosine967-C5)-methyltransferase
VKPAAQIQAVIDVLDAIRRTFVGEDRRPADAIIASYFKSNRYIGSKDKGVISELVYRVLRNKASLEWWLTRNGMQASGRNWTIAALLFLKDRSPGDIENLFDGEKFSPSRLTHPELQWVRQIYREPLISDLMPPDARYNIPDWSVAIFLEQWGNSMPQEVDALAQEAPVDLRVNTLKNVSRETLVSKLRKEKLDVHPTTLSPLGIRMKKRAAIFASPSFKEGLFEVQDEGSQLVALITEAKAGQRVIDFCAGAGGKTLALAAMMQNKGKILAFDTSAKRLEQIKERIKRAGADTVELHVIEHERDKFLKRHANGADIVLVDAPCTGTGTWRRNPDLKWRTKPSDIAELVDLQKRILNSAAKLVKTGGRLVYATCSVLKNENDQQVENFLMDHPNFRVVGAEKLWNNIPTLKERSRENSLSLSPFRDGTDGFFAAVLEKVSD